MNPLILVAIIGGIILALIHALRVKASFVFLALASGYILTTFVASGVLDFIQFFVNNYDEKTQSAVQLSLLLLPMLLTMIFLRYSVSGTKHIANVPSSILTAISTIYLVVPQLTAGVSSSVYSSDIWDLLLQYQTVLIGAAAFLSLLQFWSESRHLRIKHRGRKSK